MVFFLWNQQSRLQICFICNRSIVTGIFPKNLSIARIACIYKDGDRRKLNNYRPISVLPAFSKILEKVISSRLENHFIVNNFFTSAQFGFRKEISTANAVQRIVDSMYEAFDDKEFTVGIFLDLAKAFDSLDRTKLLRKLELYGVGRRAMDWFHSYFAKRRQFVRYENVTSSIRSVNFGVPQGSILGPVLFIIFINDIVMSSSLLRFVIYADDTNAFISSPNLRDAIRSANIELRKVTKWMADNSLTLNVDKTEYVVFHRRQLSCPRVLSKLFINRVPLNKVDSIKFLGVILDSNLVLDVQIAGVVSKLSKFIHILFKIKSHLTQSTLRMIYSSLVYPNLTYCNSVWASAYSKYLQPLYKVQKHFVRIICNKPRNGHSAPLFKKLSLLRIDQINQFVNVIYVFKSIRKRENLFKFYESSYDTRSKSSLVLSVPETFSTQSRCSVLWLGCKLWNALPISIKTIQNVSSFKCSVKRLLLSDSLLMS